MRIVITDENSRLKDFGQLIDSVEFQDFINKNITKLIKSDNAIDAHGPYFNEKERAVFPVFCTDLIHEFLKENGFFIDYSAMQYFGPFPKSYIQDLKSGELIGVINIDYFTFNKISYYAADINNKLVSNEYIIEPNGIRLHKEINVDWSKYNFEKEAEVLNLIEKAIDYGILESGKNHDEIFVIKEDNGEEFVALITKQEAVKDLIDRDQVHILKEAVEKHEKSSSDIVRLSEYGHSLYEHMNEIYQRELEKLGRLEGTCICENYIETLEDVTGWYLLTYYEHALGTLKEHSEISDTFWGFKYEEIKAVLEKCYEPVKTLDFMIGNAESKTAQNNISEKHKDNQITR